MWTFISAREQKQNPNFLLRRTRLLYKKVCNINMLAGKQLLQRMLESAARLMLVGRKS